jgi:hypothetical protein
VIDYLSTNKIESYALLEQALRVYTNYLNEDDITLKVLQDKIEVLINFK